MKLDNIVCQDSHGCVRGVHAGYFDIIDMTVLRSASLPAGHALYGDPDNGINVDSGIFRLTRANFLGPDNGIEAQGDSEVLVYDSEFDPQEIGIRVGGTAKVFVQNSDFVGPTGATVLTTHNGTTGSVDFGRVCTNCAGCSGCTGGTHTYSLFGAMASTGQNDFSAAAIGIRNERASFTTLAEVGCWEDSSPSDEVVGVVEFDPVDPTCGFQPADVPVLNISCRGSGCPQAPAP
jgi:hypothetical protein